MSNPVLLRGAYSLLHAADSCQIVPSDKMRKAVEELSVLTDNYKDMEKELADSGTEETHRPVDCDTTSRGKCRVLYELCVAGFPEKRGQLLSPLHCSIFLLCLNKVQVVEVGFVI
ncbi:hypothetical protein Tco_1320933 [Tanacetum coccineum]